MKQSLYEHTGRLCTVSHAHIKASQPAGSCSQNPEELAHSYIRWIEAPVRTHVHIRHRMICAELYIAYLCIRTERRRRGERNTCVLYRDIFNTFTVVFINGYITTLCQQMGKSQLSLYKHIQEKERLHKLPTRRRCKPLRQAL